MTAAIETPFGHSLPPEGPHTVTFHFPTWAAAVRFRDGDMSLMAKIKSIYPRFMPFGPSAQVSNAVMTAFAAGLAN
jgi:cystathionine gamma-synthase